MIPVFSFSIDTHYSETSRSLCGIVVTQDLEKSYRVVTDENIENIAEKENTGAAGCGANVNCPIKSSYAWQKCVVNAALRRPGNDAERRYFSFKFAPHLSISRV